MTHIDTAEMYGSGAAEEIVGKAIAGRREDVFLVSKVLPQHASRDGTVAACAASLARLDTDRLDCYLLHWRGEYPRVHLDGGEQLTAKCLLIATGADYRLLNVEGCERFEGRGVYYAATPTEAQMCRGSDVAVVGGGNSAGQAAVFLAAQVRKVYLVVRGDSLYKDMSSYLARRIEGTPAIEVLLHTEVRRMHGDNTLGEVELANNKTGDVRTLRVAALFSFIGAVPRTDWLPAEITKDAKGFVRTGPALAASGDWTARRPPYLLETSRPGVFAAGDVRAGSVKRVASAVGEGAMAVQLVHEYLKEM